MRERIPSYNFPGLNRPSPPPPLLHHVRYIHYIWKKISPLSTIPRRLLPLNRTAYHLLLRVQCVRRKFDPALVFLAPINSNQCLCASILPTFIFANVSSVKTLNLDVIAGAVS